MITKHIKEINQLLGREQPVQERLKHEVPEQIREVEQVQPQTVEQVLERRKIENPLPQEQLRRELDLVALRKREEVLELPRGEVPEPQPEVAVVPQDLQVQVVLEAQALPEAREDNY